MVERE
ncbi:hypothetical protein VTH06DRAFT_2831 [Thermothelomyces fergusii]|jgi:hypothetical protein